MSYACVFIVHWNYKNLISLHSWDDSKKYLIQNAKIHAGNWENKLRFIMLLGTKDSANINSSHKALCFILTVFIK